MNPLVFVVKLYNATVFNTLTRVKVMVGVVLATLVTMLTVSADVDRRYER